MLIHWWHNYLVKHDFVIALNRFGNAIAQYWPLRKLDCAYGYTVDVVSTSGFMFYVESRVYEKWTNVNSPWTNNIQNYCLRRKYSIAQIYRGNVCLFDLSFDLDEFSFESSAFSYCYIRNNELKDKLVRVFRSTLLGITIYNNLRSFGFWYMLFLTDIFYSFLNSTYFSN